jgi:hypothetical protein
VEEGMCRAWLAPNQRHVVAAKCWKLLLERQQLSRAEKDSKYIQKCCEQVMHELQTLCSTQVLGFVMDSASANRKALLNMLNDYPKLMNLPCLAHALSLLIKDLAKYLPWVESAYATAVTVSNALATEAIKHMLQQSMLAQTSKTVFSIATHSESRFGSQHIVLRTVMRALQPLKKIVAKDSLRSCCGTAE